MVGESDSVEGVFTDFLTPILPNIGGESTREELIKLHQLISRNVASVFSSLRGGWHIHLALTMKRKYYVA